MALPENWEFRESTRQAYPVLGSYLRFTFGKLKLDGMVYEDRSTKEPLAAFNTGLVTRLYEPIIAVFKENTHPDFTEIWRFEKFCVAGKGHLGKEIIRRFDRPPRAKYFDSISELLKGGSLSCIPILFYCHICRTVCEFGREAQWGEELSIGAG